MTTPRISAISPPSTAPAQPAQQPFRSVRIAGVTRSRKSVVARANVAGLLESHRLLILSPLTVLPV